MNELDPVIHQPARLRIMAAIMALPAGDRVDFTWLRDSLVLTDGNLGAHLLKLEEAGYLKIDKKFVARKPKTIVELSNKGRAAFDDYVAGLRGILGAGGENGASNSSS